MHQRLAASLVIIGLLPAVGAAQDTIRYRSAVVALTDDPALRQSFEQTLVERARAHDYDAVTTYDITPDVRDLDRNRFLRELGSRGIEAVLMLRPAAIGPGSSLEAVRDEVAPDVYADMQAFAAAVGSASTDDLIAVVHTAIYLLVDGEPRPISAGAVWLDEEVESQQQGIERLQDLIVANVDAVRPVIREHLGLPPLE